MDNIKSKNLTDYLTERGASARQDDHHGDVVSAVRHLQQLHLVVGEVPVPEPGLLVHHVDRAAVTHANLEVCDEDVFFVELVLPLTLRGRNSSSVRQLSEENSNQIL